MLPDGDKYVFDLDGTLCNSKGSNYKFSTPIISRIEKVNSLYDAGNTIFVNTARGMNSLNGNKLLVYLRWYFTTKRQLKKWGVKHHGLRVGKPSGDFYIDDKAINAKEFFEG